MLPESARNLLIIASTVGEAGSFERICAIDDVVYFLKRRYPEFFK